MANNLLRLPAELRLRIYDHVIPTVPLSEPRSHYIGLLYASKQIRSEVEPEILKAMRNALITFLNAARRGYIASITFKEFRTLHELENLILHVHMDCEPSTGQSKVQAYHRMKRLRRLIEWRFNVLTVNVSGTERYAAHVGPATWWRGFVFRFALTNGDLPLPAIKMIRIDWREANVVLGAEDIFMTETWHARLRKDGLWGYDEKRNGDGRVVAVVMKWKKE